VIAFVDELAWLHHQHNIRFFWLADENPTTSKMVWKQLLEEISQRGLPIGLCASIRAQDIVRDADILPHYRQAGFLYILMGVETVTDVTLAKVHKGSSVDDAYQAVRLLRAHNIMSIVDYIFGIEDEIPHTIVRALRGLLHYDGDFVNALYLTPHAWTPLGRDMQDTPVIEPNLWRWDYRHQVIAVPHLSPTQLFFGVKLVELLYHLYPQRIWRIITTRDQRLRQQLRFAFWHTSRVFWYEIYEHILDEIRTAYQRSQNRKAALKTGVARNWSRSNQK
jgi:anaerobic magnesium-protoporphyrin IX monomethyl ester cyclase